MARKWVAIAGAPDYEVSDTGQVRSYKYKKARILKPGITSVGYYSVNICTPERKVKSPTRLVHRLVAEAFIPNPGGRRTVNHIDGNKLNNLVSNLEWATDKENARHAFDSGLRREDQCPVICIETGRLFPSQSAAARALGLFQANIHKVLIGEYKTTGGFRFKRAS